MLKRIISLLLIAIVILVANISMATDPVTEADSAKEPKPAEEKPVKKHIKKAQPTPQEIVPEDAPDIDSADTQEPVEEQEGPPYPFIYDNTSKEHLACRTTPFIEPEYHNTKPIHKGNNLMRKPGGYTRATGNYIQLTGTIMDENCLPIQNAIIEIWQTDSNGHYEWEYDTTSYWELPLAGQDKNFLFSGSAYTDNFGHFNILTVFPGGKDNKAPYINVIVKRAGYDELHTRMYFADHPRNNADPTLKSLKGEGKTSLLATGSNIDPKGVYEGRVYNFNVTMHGIDAYKRY